MPKPTTAQRAENARVARLEREQRLGEAQRAQIARQIEEGSLRVRKMTAAERAKWPFIPPEPKRGKR